MEPNENSKRMLIVDDEPNVAIALAENLEELSCEYSIEIANSAEEAITKIQEKNYTLVLTDYKMPAMTGLDLARAVQQFSPDTQIVLMTAYGTPDLRETVKSLEIGGYIDKPFTLTEIKDMVKEVGERDREKGDLNGSEISGDIPVRELFQNLLSATGARCVLLINSGGYPVETAGVTKGLNVPATSALVAANFAASFKSSYHEGTEYNMYAYDVNGELLLAVVFGSEIKPGAVWFYTKQTANALVPLVLEKSSSIEFSGDFTVALDTELEQLFSNQDHQGDEPASPKEMETTPLINLQEAIAAGILPPQFETTEETQHTQDEMNIEVTNE